LFKSPVSRADKVEPFAEDFIVDALELFPEADGNLEDDFEPALDCIFEDVDPALLPLLPLATDPDF